MRVQQLAIRSNGEVFFLGDRLNRYSPEGVLLESKTIYVNDYNYNRETPEGICLDANDVLYGFISYNSTWYQEFRFFRIVDDDKRPAWIVAKDDTNTESSILNACGFNTEAISGADDGLYLYTDYPDDGIKKFNSDGNEEWFVKQSDIEIDVSWDVVGHPEHGVLFSSIAGMYYDANVARIDKNGNYMWVTDEGYDAAFNWGMNGMVYMNINSYTINEVDPATGQVSDQIILPTDVDIMDFKVDGIKNVYVEDDKNHVKKFDKGGNLIWSMPDYYVYFSNGGNIFLR